LDDETFFNEVERFVNQLEAWTRIIRDYNGQKVEDKGQQDEVETPESSLDIYHMKV
jgi:hypothetical protein